MSQKSVLYDELFYMQDTKHDFGIRLSTILQCIKIAESKYAIPRIEQRWWESFDIQDLPPEASDHGITIAKLASDNIFDHTDCQECLENWIFKIHDETGRFILGLKTVMTCLAFAQMQNVIPKLCADWWSTIRLCF